MQICHYISASNGNIFILYLNIGGLRMVGHDAKDRDGRLYRFGHPQIVILINHILHKQPPSCAMVTEQAA